MAKTANDEYNKAKLKRIVQNNPPAVQRVFTKHEL